MKNVALFIVALFLCATQAVVAQSIDKVYEITITTTDKNGNREVKEMVIEGEDLSQEDIDELIQKEIDDSAEEVDVNVNVNVSQGNSTTGEEAKTITKIIKQRSNLTDENKIIVEEHDMEIEVKGDKVYINGEEVVEGDFGDKKVRILRLGDGDDDEIKEILEGEQIDIQEGDNIFFIEKEESREGIAFLGVTVGRNEGDGVIIEYVLEGTSAEEMGLQVGDKLISINGKEVNAYSSLSKTIKGYLPGDKVTIEYSREGIVKEAIVALSDYENYNDNVRWIERGSRDEGHKKGRHHHRRHHRANPDQAALGVGLSENEEGIIVDFIQKGSAAEKAGIEKGDQIVVVNKAEMLSIEQLQATIQAHKAGDEIKLKVLRDGKKKTIKATLQTRMEKVEKYPRNKSERIERIVIKDRRDERIEERELGGAIKLSDFNLSPNPSQGKFNVSFAMDELSAGDHFFVRIISLDGKIVREDKITEFDGRFTKAYDITDLGTGIFLYQVEKNEQTFTKRFVIENE